MSDEPSKPVPSPANPAPAPAPAPGAAPGPGPASAPGPAESAAPGAAPPAHGHRGRLLAGLALAVALAFGGWGLWRALTASDEPAPPPAGAAAMTPRQMQAELESLR